MDFSLFGSLIQTDALITEIPLVGFFFFLKLENRSIRKLALQWEITPKMFTAGLSQHVRLFNGTRWGYLGQVFDTASLLGEG